VRGFWRVIDNLLALSDRSNPKDGAKDTRVTATYSSLDMALSHKWTALKKRQAKELNPAVVFSITGTFWYMTVKHVSHTSPKALWEFQARQGILPNDPSHAEEIQEIADAMLGTAEVTPTALVSVPQDIIAYVQRHVILTLR
jgi:ubiquitin-like 1-activating enzyme E1 A